jgi:hypothetical protein
LNSLQQQEISLKNATFASLAMQKKNIAVVKK